MSISTSLDLPPLPWSTSFHLRRDRVPLRTARQGPSNMTSPSMPHELFSCYPRTNALFSGFEPGPLASQLSSHTPIAIPYKDPVDWARFITSAAGALGIAITMRFISPILKSRWTWAAGTIITSLIMTSGYMFTRIRGSPYTGGNGNWIAGGFQNQFGQEVHVVALICEYPSST